VDSTGFPRILVQSNASPNWDGVGVNGWLVKADPPIDLNGRLKLGQLKVGQKFRFRLRGNPCVCRGGKRLGLLRQEEQEAWIEKQGQAHGFALPFFPSLDFSNASPKRIDVKIGQERMLHGRQHGGNAISIFSVLYDGVLSVTEVEKFKEALRTGIGHGKSMGLGMLSVFPVV
jgi:CRISPR system Cascade subunit CasE